MFITFEGPDGSGKSTQLQRLAVWLRGRGVEVLLTREPGGTPISDRIRAILLDPACMEMVNEAEVLLYSAARAQHVAEVIRPQVARGGVVLCDRFADSTLAYQGYGRGLPLATLEIITRFATGGLVPDLVVYLDLDVEAGLRRKLAHAEDDASQWNRLERAARAFHERVRAGYLALATAAPDRWLVVDGDQPIDEVQAVICRRVGEFLGL